jgi:hypothetical protein
LPTLRTVAATRYVTPLREGGSLPAVVEASDDGLYVLKFRGAGQGPKALIAELVGSEIARALGLPVPEIVLIELDAALGRSEPDYEIRELINASAGLNLALDYLPGSLTYDPAKPVAMDEDLASRIVWLDAYLTNVDRTARNTNMLIWHRELWLIDHAAAFIFHHTWTDYREKAKAPFVQVKDHVLLPLASKIIGADVHAKQVLTEDVLREIVDLVPESWLGGVPQFKSIEEHRAAYVEFLTLRLASSTNFVQEAIDARKR